MATVQFAAKCHAGDLVPGSRTATLGRFWRVIAISFEMPGCHRPVEMLLDQCDRQYGAKLPSTLRTMVAPAIYFVTSPVIAIIGLFMFSAFMVYVVVPVAAIGGLYFNDAAKEQKQRNGLKKKCQEVLVENLPEWGVSWDDIEDRLFLSASICDSGLGIRIVGRVRCVLAERDPSGWHGRERERERGTV